MLPRTYLRMEGLAALAVGLLVFFDAGGPIWLLVVLALAPDLSMLGYLAGPRVGATTYNVVHTYVLPVALAGAGFWVGSALAIQVAAVWLGHIGADRLFVYGLKYPTGFEDTHLSEQPAPVAALAESEQY